MEQPQGFEDKDKPKYVNKLKRALYGLKQVPKTCHRKIQEFLIQKRFAMKTSYSSLFVKR